MKIHHGCDAAGLSSHNNNNNNNKCLIHTEETKPKIHSINIVCCSFIHKREWQNSLGKKERHKRDNAASETWEKDQI